jgi:serine/threonine protein kinase
MLQPGEILYGEKGTYTIASEFSRGGQSEVYLANSNSASQSVVIKLIPNPDVFDTLNFLNECVALEKLNHPNIVKILDSSPAMEITMFIVMELLEGSTLKDHLERNVFPLSQAVIIAKEVMKGITTAHHQGIIHRDLKPGNIFITNQGLFKVFDFGLVHTARGSWAGGGGTIPYMSPEQAQKLHVDLKTDIFSFGSVTSSS